MNITLSILYNGDIHKSISYYKSFKKHFPTTEKTNNNICRTFLQVLQSSSLLLLFTRHCHLAKLLKLSRNPSFLIKLFRYRYSNRICNESSMEMLKENSTFSRIEDKSYTLYVYASPSVYTYSNRIVLYNCNAIHGQGMNFNSHNIA